MGRLTKAENGKYVHCNIDSECTGMCGSCKRNTEIRQKLKHYEDLEEQGLLIRLPCKVGDKVYRITNANTKIVEDEVLWFERHGSNFALVVLKEYGDVSTVRFGKTIFTSKAEAEQAMERRKKCD